MPRRYHRVTRFRHRRAASLDLIHSCGLHRHRRAAYLVRACVLACRSLAMTASTQCCHNYIGHNFIDHNYIGHNYTGHNYITCFGRDADIIVTTERSGAKSGGTVEYNSHRCSVVDMTVMFLCESRMPGPVPHRLQPKPRRYNQTAIPKVSWHRLRRLEGP